MNKSYSRAVELLIFGLLISNVTRYLCQHVVSTQHGIYLRPG